MNEFDLKIGGLFQLRHLYSKMVVNTKLQLEDVTCQHMQDLDRVFRCRVTGTVGGINATKVSRPMVIKCM